MAQHVYSNSFWGNDRKPPKKIDGFFSCKVFIDLSKICQNYVFGVGGVWIKETAKIFKHNLEDPGIHVLERIGEKKRMENKIQKLYPRKFKAGNLKKIILFCIRKII